MYVLELKVRRLGSQWPKKTQRGRDSSMQAYYVATHPSYCRHALVLHTCLERFTTADMSKWSTPADMSGEVSLLQTCLNGQLLQTCLERFYYCRHVYMVNSCRHVWRGLLLQTCLNGQLLQTCLERASTADTYGNSQLLQTSLGRIYY
jgi:hypothetical protein